MTDVPVLTDLQLKVLGIVQEFKGLGGIATNRLVRESGTKPDYVDECLKYFKDRRLVKEKQGYPQSFWTVTDAGQAALNGHTTVPEKTIEIISAPAGSFIVAQTPSDDESGYDIPEVPPPKDDPIVWYVCDHADEQGKKCGKRFASEWSLKVHMAMAHKIKAERPPQKLDMRKHPMKRESVKGEFPCTEKGCTKVFDTAQGLLMHGQRVHLKTCIKSGRGTVEATTKVNQRIKELYPDHSIKEIARELGLTFQTVNMRVHRFLKQGNLQRKLPRQPRQSVATKEEAISPTSPAGTNVPIEKIVPNETRIPIGILGTEINLAPAPPDPFAGLAKLLAELNAIPGVRVSITISLGVGS